MLLDLADLLEEELNNTNDDALLGLLGDMVHQKKHILMGTTRKRLAEIILEEFDLGDIDHELEQRFVNRRGRCG